MKVASLTYQKTRFPELVYSKIAGNAWSFFSTETGSQVGPVYKTKGELLGDLTRYAKDSWQLD
jgi:hypothetical protein